MSSWTIDHRLDGVFIRDRGKPYETRQEFTYIRLDVLKRFLRENGYVLYWSVQGERSHRLPYEKLHKPNAYGSGTPYKKAFFQLLRYSTGRQVQPVHV